MFLDLQEVLDSIEKASREAAPRRPDSRIVETPHWFQVTTPSVKHARYSGVIYSVMNEVESDEKIARTIREFESLELPFRWEVGPTSLPKDMRERLGNFGLKLQSEITGMFADPEKISHRERPGLEIELVTASSAEEWVKTAMQGWAFPEAFHPFLLEELRKDLATSAPRVFYFLARLQGEPAGAATLRLVDRTGYLQGSSVRPRFRKQGIYGSLVTYRLKILRERGIPAATVQCLKESSAGPICLRIGFEPACEIQIYHSSK